MTRVPPPIGITLLAALAAGCATKAPPESRDPSYLRGRSSYEAARWPEAEENLAAFLESSCRFGPAAGCERALWMKVQIDLQTDRPAQAVVDADRARILGPPAERLEPPLAALRGKAMARIEAQDRTAERTARLEVSFRNEVAAGCQLLAVTLALDLDPAQLVPLDHLDGKSSLLDPMVRPGERLLTVTGRFECPLRGGKLEMLGRATHAVFVGPAVPTKVLVLSHLRTDMLPLASLPEKLAFDFKEPPPSAGAK